MEPVLIACYKEIHQQFDCSVDDILTNPKYREIFLNKVRGSFAEGEEKTILKKLINLRKQSKLPRKHEAQ